jgi:hypothetical protein
MIRRRPATARTVLDVAVFWGPVLTGATTTMIFNKGLLQIVWKVFGRF